MIHENGGIYGQLPMLISLEGKRFWNYDILRYKEVSNPGTGPSLYITFKDGTKWEFFNKGSAELLDRHLDASAKID